MATFSAAARNAAVDAVVALLNVGTSFPGPVFSVGSATSNFMIVAQLPAAPFGAAVNGRADLLAPFSTLCFETDVATDWRLSSRGLVVHIFDGTVGTSGAELNITPSLSMVLGQVYVLNFAIEML